MIFIVRNNKLSRNIYPLKNIFTKYLKNIFTKYFYKSFKKIKKISVNNFFKCIIIPDIVNYTTMYIFSFFILSFFCIAIIMQKELWKILQ